MNVRWIQMPTTTWEKQRNEFHLKTIKHELNTKKNKPTSRNIVDQIIRVEEFAKKKEFVRSVKHDVGGLMYP
jgi:hypothetical protein